MGCFSSRPVATETNASSQSSPPLRLNIEDTLLIPGVSGIEKQNNSKGIGNGPRFIEDICIGPDASHGTDDHHTFTQRDTTHHDGELMSPCFPGE
jgi:hypothetical protein